MYKITLKGKYSVKFRFWFWTKTVTGSIDESETIPTNSLSYTKALDLPGKLPVNVVLKLSTEGLGVAATVLGFPVYEHLFAVADVLKAPVGFDLMPVLAKVNNTHGVSISELKLNIQKV